jgi:hypothetical protein
MPVVSVQYGNASTDHFTVDVLSTGELSLPAYYYTPVFCLLFTGGAQESFVRAKGAPERRSGGDQRVGLAPVRQREPLRREQRDQQVAHEVSGTLRLVELGDVLDDLNRSVIRHQVEMGVAVRMACLELLTRDLGNGPPIL